MSVFLYFSSLLLKFAFAAATVRTAFPPIVLIISCSSPSLPLLCCRYSQDGRYLISRDYLTVKVWDVNMETRPIKTVALHDYLRPMLYDLFTSDIIFDKFEVCCSPDGKKFASGSYRCVTRCCM